ncbi:MAG: phage head-tail connector protein [Planctomycetes bacterium]|nr:phage head-tail connector protein [Planctomycetota bacterium]
MIDTLANVKASLLISGTTDDALLNRLLDAADGFITEFTGRDFVGGTFTETHTAGRSLVFLRNYPVTSVTSLKVDSSRQFGSDTARAADSFVVHANRGVIESVCGPFLCPRDGHRDDWPAALQVVYDTATSAVPAAVKQAFCELIGHWYRFAKTNADLDYQMLVTKVDVDGEKDWPWSIAAGEPLPQIVLQLLAPYRTPPA